MTNTITAQTTTVHLGILSPMHDVFVVTARSASRQAATEIRGHFYTRGGSEIRDVLEVHAAFEAIVAKF